MTVFLAISCLCVLAAFLGPAFSRLTVDKTRRTAEPELVPQEADAHV